MNSSLWQGKQNINYRKPISKNDSFDVVIIGAGFSGLWSAFHLNQFQPNLKIAILEKEYVDLEQAAEMVDGHLLNIQLQVID